MYFDTDIYLRWFKYEWLYDEIDDQSKRFIGNKYQNRSIYYQCKTGANSLYQMWWNDVLLLCFRCALRTLINKLKYVMKMNAIFLFKLNAILFFY
jgi:hypothetical protein